MIELISSTLTSFITILVVLLSFRNLANEQFKFSWKIVIILILGTLGTVVLYYINIPLLKNVYSIVFFIIIFKSVSEKKLIELIYYALIIWLFGLAFDLIAMLVLSIFGLNEILQNLNSIYVRTVTSVIMTTSLYFILLLPFIKKFIHNIVDKLIKIKPSVLFEIIIILFLITLSTVSAINIERTSVTSYVILIVLFILYLIILTINKHFNEKRLKEVNELLMKNNEFFVKLDSDYRVLKHNLTNQLLGIKAASDNKTKKLIDELIKNYNSKFIAPKDINKVPKSVNGLVYEKVYNFNKPEIKLVVENTIKEDLLKLLKPKSYNEFCEYLGVIIDNALEAAYTSTDKAIMIDFYESAEYVGVKVINTFNNVIDIESYGSKNYSTKGNSRGIGLFSLLKRKTVQTQTTVINDLYQIELKARKLSFK